MRVVGQVNRVGQDGRVVGQVNRVGQDKDCRASE